MNPNVLGESLSSDEPQVLQVSLGVRPTTCESEKAPGCQCEPSVSPRTSGSSGHGLQSQSVSLRTEM